MRVLKWLGTALAVSVLALIIVGFHQEILTGIAVLVAVTLGMALVMRVLMPSNPSSSTGPPDRVPGWVWAEQAKDRPKTELAEREAARIEQQAARVEQAAELATWNQYQRFL